MPVKPPRGRPRKAPIELRPPRLTALKGGRTALHEEARERLRMMIVRGKLAPGTGVGEASLSAALGMSRTPLREALKLLADEGLVEIRNNRGAVISPIRYETIPDLFEVMAGIERLGAELAAHRIDARALARLRTLQGHMEQHYEAERLVAYFDVNQQIHKTIVEASGNAVLVATHQSLFARVERVRFFALGSRPRWDESVAEHRSILAALDDRDSARAGAALAAHVRHTGERAMELLRRDELALAPATAEGGPTG